jgi:hypothetical protein
MQIILSNIFLYYFAHHDNPLPLSACRIYFWGLHLDWPGHTLSNKQISVRDSVVDWSRSNYLLVDT